MEEVNVELPLEGANHLHAEVQEECSDAVVSRIKKPRAIIIKATNKDFDEITELIKKFPEVQILYVTTGPAASILHVTRIAKPKPFELENPLEQPTFFSVE